MHLAMRSCWALPVAALIFPAPEKSTFCAACGSSREREANGRSDANSASQFKTLGLNHIRGAKITANPVLWVENSSARHFFHEILFSFAAKDDFVVAR
jgi:hypothetical protein